MVHLRLDEFIQLFIPKTFQHLHHGVMQETMLIGEDFRQQISPHGIDFPAKRRAFFHPGKSLTNEGQHHVRQIAAFAKLLETGEPVIDPLFQRKRLEESFAEFLQCLQGSRLPQKALHQEIPLREELLMEGMVLPLPSLQLLDQCLQRRLGQRIIVHSTEPFP